MEDRDLEELHRLWELKEKGAISEDEYLRLKSRILGREDPPAEQETKTASEPDFAARVQPAQNQPVKGPTTKQAVGIGCLALFAIVLILGLIGSNSNQNQASTAANETLNVDTNLVTTDMNATTDVAALASEQPNSNWSYSEDEDKVRGGTTYYASTTSTNSIAQEEPYDSDTTMRLAVRKSPAYGTDVILTISSGQMMCPSYEGCSGTVRFDDGPAQRLQFNGPADDSSDTVFVGGAKQFISKLRSAKKVTIEKTIYQAGSPQFEFDVHGLKWEH